MSFPFSFSLALVTSFSLFLGGGPGGRGVVYQAMLFSSFLLLLVFRGNALSCRKKGGGRFLDTRCEVEGSRADHDPLVKKARRILR